MVFCGILDGHAAELATVPVVLPPTTVLGRDLPHHERHILITSLMPKMRVPNAKGVS